jgi:hypothetical protein
MKASSLLCAALLALTALPVQAASQYDGQWSGKNCYEADITMRVTNGNVTGSMKTGREDFGIRGKIAESGAFDGGWLKGQFTGSDFAGVYTRQASTSAARVGTQCKVTAARAK